MEEITYGVSLQCMKTVSWEWWYAAYVYLRNYYAWKISSRTECLKLENFGLYGPIPRKMLEKS